MKYILSALISPFVVFVVTKMLLSFSKPKHVRRGEVYLNKFFLVVGAFFSVVFLVPSVIVLFLGEELWVSLVAFLVALPAMALVVACINCRITYDKDGFEVRNFFGIKRAYTYDQVTGVKSNTNETFLYMGDRRVMIDAFMIGGLDFYDHVLRKYKAIHRGQYPPRINKSKYDLFKGNVREPARFLLLYCLFAFFPLMLLGVAVGTTYFAADSTENTIKETVSFVSCNVWEDEIVLRSTDNQIYKVRFIDEQSETEQFDPRKLQVLCDGQKKMTTYSEEISPKHQEDYYSIKAIVYDEEYLLTFEETNRWHTEEYDLLVVLSGVALLIWALFVLCSVIVGRNPKKFSNRVIHFFFKGNCVKN